MIENDIYIIDKLTPNVIQKDVFESIECTDSSPIYDTVIEEYEEMLDEMLQLIKPFGIIGYDEIPEDYNFGKYKAGTKVIYAITSIGHPIKEKCTQYFDEGDYLKGMLSDAIADSALFSFEPRMLEVLKTFCDKNNFGICDRLEAPQNIPMDIHKRVFEKLNLGKKYDFRLSDGLMFDPVKTACNIFVITENKKQFKVSHDCSKCGNYNCQFRKIPKIEIEVIQNNISKNIFVEKDETLLNALIRNNFYLSAPCGGNGKCGKCKVKVCGKNLEISLSDKQFFNKKQLDDGYRLACTFYPKETLQVFLGNTSEDSFEIVGDLSNNSVSNNKTDDFYDIAIDIGTTTIAMELLGHNNHNIIASTTLINGQRKLGGDVISRIQASMDGKKEILQTSICNDLYTGIQKLVLSSNIEYKNLKHIVIAGNTTMVHLLMGYNCDTLGIYPFTPVNINTIESDFKEILNSDISDAKVSIMPGISTYVGGDIVSGMLACDFDKTKDVNLLIDLGTNGEMALGNNEKIYVTSTAAGPAFEGGNITCGTGSIAGAICSVKIDKENVSSVKTILDAPPVGICGTGVVEAMSELLKAGIVDETGCFEDDYVDEGFILAKDENDNNISFTQSDVRELQLAKSAIRAGIETLLIRYGIKKENVNKIFIAGGFGYKLDKDKAIEIGLLPVEFKDKIEAIGNSSLQGAAKYLSDIDKIKRVRNIVDLSQEISLSTDKDFMEFYMDYMYFEEI